MEEENKGHLHGRNLDVPIDVYQFDARSVISPRLPEQNCRSRVAQGYTSQFGDVIFSSGDDTTKEKDNKREDKQNGSW